MTCTHDQVHHVTESDGSVWCRTCTREARAEHYANKHKAVLDLLKRRGPLSHWQVAGVLQLRRSYARDVFRSLERVGLIKRTGRVLDLEMRGDRAQVFEYEILEEGVRDEGARNEGGGVL